MIITILVILIVLLAKMIFYSNANIDITLILMSAIIVVIAVIVIRQETFREIIRGVVKFRFISRKFQVALLVLGLEL